jgi:hypothetical protein
MDSDKLKDLVIEGKSIRQISAILDKSSGSVRYWLKKYGLTTYKEPKYSKNCKFCNIKLTQENTYPSKNRWSCKSCANDYRIKKFIETKLKLVELYGGKCKCCGFNKHYSALEFHHLDPSQKEFNLSVTNNGWNKLIREADKCVLLCSNCHRMVHAGIINLPDDSASEETCLTSRH